MSNKKISGVLNSDTLARYCAPNIADLVCCFLLFSHQQLVVGGCSGQRCRDDAEELLHLSQVDIIRPARCPHIVLFCDARRRQFGPGERPQFYARRRPLRRKCPCQWWRWRYSNTWSWRRWWRRRWWCWLWCTRRWTRLRTVDVILHSIIYENITLYQLQRR